MGTTIPADTMQALFNALESANGKVSTYFPGDAPGRQPVHTVYGGAHLFRADTIQKLGAIARRALQEHAPDPATLGSALRLDPLLAERVYPKLLAKLEHEPVEDFRVDFEDGFGNRPDEEEDRWAEAAARQVAEAALARALPAGIGIRIKPLTEELKRRSLRTFDLFLTALLDATGNTLPRNFVVTLTKITAPEQVAALAAACGAFEAARGLPHDSLRFELMIETPQSIVAADGTVALPHLLTRGGGRIVAAHFGTYDYTASLNITAAYQGMTHPACDFAKHVMQVALAGTGIRLSDGATNVMPVGPHRPSADRPLSTAERDENTRVVRQAWRLHADQVRHSLAGGFYQGWDLHPAQLPSRFATVFAFFLDGLGAASERLRHFVRTAAQATLVGGVFDDAATGQGLLNYFLRAMNCGAITEEEALSGSGLTLDELRSRSFAKILENRRGA